MNSELANAYDAVLIVRFQTGCDESLEELIERHAEAVRAAVVKRIGGESCVADDISQEVWIQVIRNLSKLNNPIAWRAWLFQIVNRQVALFFREKQRPFVPLEAVFDSIMDIEQHVDYGVDIRELVQSLPEPFRSVVRLRYWESMSYEAIADLLAVPVGTVRSRLHEGRRRLTNGIQKKVSNDK